MEFRGQTEAAEEIEKIVGLAPILRRRIGEKAAKVNIKSRISPAKDESVAGALLCQRKTRKIRSSVREFRWQAVTTYELREYTGMH
jgi:hypothetical protein